MQMKLVEPLKWLFNDEVREMGKLLGVSASFVSRHPFPGPGLVVQILDDVYQENALETIRLVRIILTILCLQLNLLGECGYSSSSLNSFRTIQFKKNKMQLIVN